MAGGQVTRAARIETEEPFTLWFRTPEANAHLLCERAESFVAGTIMLAMARSCALRVHVPLSPSFLRAIEEFQAIWSCWVPRFRPIEIVPDSEVEAGSTPAGSTPDAERPRAMTVFSGGVDSCYTVWRHTQKLCGRRAVPIRSALMVEGFHPGHYESIFVRWQKMVQSMGIELIRFATNFRFVTPLSYPLHTFGSGLAACLLMFQESHSHGLIPSSDAYHQIYFPLGSTALTDRLLGTRNFFIEYDGAEATRTEKLRAIMQWPGVAEQLRVCNQFDQPDRNCGRCEKCVRNILCLRILGIHQPPCFPTPLAKRHLRNLRLRGSSWEAMQQVLLSAREAEITEPWVRTLEQTLRRERFYEMLEPTREKIKHALPSKMLTALRAIKTPRQC